MKDKEIRKILIEYLKATNNEIRIFQDVMQFTDRFAQRTCNRRVQNLKPDS